MCRGETAHARGQLDLHTPARGPVHGVVVVEAAELGGHAAQALEILAAAGDRPADLAKAIDDVEKLTRLFISKKQAEALGRQLRETLKAAP